MKKQTILKVLSFVLLLTLVLSALLMSGCNEEIKADIEATKTDLETAEADLKKAKEDIAKLQTATSDLTKDSATKQELTDEAAALQTKIDANKAELENLEADLAALSAASATQADLEALIARVAKLEKDIADETTGLVALKAKIDDANTAIEAAKTELKGLIAAVSADVAALDDTYATDEALKAVSDAVAALDATYATDAQLSSEIEAVQGAIAAAITKAENDLAAAKADLAAKIAAISGEDIEDVLSVLDFSNGYQSVTEILCDDENEYSFKAFRELYKQKKAENFSQATFEAYTEFYRLQELKLTRAYSLEQVKAIFDSLKQYQDEYMVSDVEQFIELLEALEDHGVTVEEGQLDALNEAYDSAKDANGFTDELQDRYEAVLAARERLEDAWEDALAAAEKAVEYKLLAKTADGGYVLGDAILYKAIVKQHIDEVKALYDAIEETYFQDDMTSAYGLGMEDLPGYVPFNEQKDIYDALEEAKQALDDVELTTLPVVSDNPLFSDKAGIDADLAAIEAWAVENGIDKKSQNYTLIVNASLNEKKEGLTLSKAAELKNYADAMDAINTEKVLGVVDEDEKNLKEQVAAAIEAGAEGVLWTRIPALEQMFADIETLEEAVEGVAGFDFFEDENVNAMLGLDEDAWDILGDIQNRINLLKQAKADVDALNVEVSDKIGNVELGDMQTIEAWEEELKDIFNEEYQDDDPKLDLSFDEDEPESVNYINYLAMTEAIRANLDTLRDEYDDGVSTLQDVYDMVRDAINGENVYLTDLAKILWANAKVVELTENINADAFADIMLKDIDEATGATTYISYLDFQTKLVAKVAEVVKLAETAEADALIIDEFEPFNLNLTEDYVDILEDVMDWIETYLGVTYEGDLADRIAALIADEATRALFAEAEYDENGKPITNEAGQCNILGITNKNYPDNGAYQFVAEVDEAIEAAQIMAEELEAAEADWADVAAAYVALDPALDIHDTAITAAYNLYKAYETRYYAGEIVNDQFEELELFNIGIGPKAGLKTLKTAFDAKVAAAEALYNSIMDQAEALINAGIPDESPEGIQDTLDKANALLSDMETYKTLYCDKADTNQCKFIKGDLDAALIAFKAKAKAYVVKVFVEDDNKDEIVYSGISYNITDPTDKLTIKGIFCIDRIDARKSAAKVIEDYELFLSIALKDGVDKADYALVDAEG